MLSRDNSVNNNGNNTGTMVGTNYGIVNSFNMETKATSLILALVKELGAICTNEDNQNEDLRIFDINAKIQYNCVIKYKEIIAENSKYLTCCDAAFNIFDDSNIGKKKIILNCIRNFYLESKGQLLCDLKDSSGSDIEKIRNNADFLIDDVKKKIKEMLNSANNYEDMSIEEISYGLTIIVCYCFIKCKILEKPV